MENAGIKAGMKTLLEADSIDALDLLEAAVDATHVANRGPERVVASHASSKGLLSIPNSNIDKKFHQIIQQCIEVYWTTPIVRNIIDLMVDFASEGLQIEHKVDRQQRFYREWARRSGFSNLIPQIFHTLLLTGTCVIIRRDGKIVPTTRREIGQANLDIKRQKAGTFPIGYTILNPIKIKFAKSDFFGGYQAFYKLSYQEQQRINNPKDDRDRAVVRGMPPEFRNVAIKEGLVPLDPARTTILSYKKLPWAAWSMPLIFSALDDINFKKMLRRMDESSAADVIKAVVVFKLGDMVNKMPPDKARFKKLASLLNGVSQAKNIVWDDLIKIEDSFPPIDKILGKEKYEVVNRDILSNFGVSEILVSGNGGNFSNGFLSVRALQEKLETLRDNVLYNFVVPEFDRVRQAASFSKRPATRFHSMSLRDENAYNNYIKELLDRHVISPETAIEVAGRDPRIEKSRVEKARKDKGWEQLGPFNPPPSQSESEAPKAPQPGGPGGRPPDTNVPQENERNTAPVGEGLSSIIGWILYNVGLAELGWKRSFSVEDYRTAVLIGRGSIQNKKYAKEYAQIRKILEAYNE